MPVLLRSFTGRFKSESLDGLIRIQWTISPEYAFLITQVLLAVLSLYNILIYVYSDMRIVYMRSKKTIALVKEKIEEK